MHRRKMALSNLFPWTLLVLFLLTACGGGSSGGGSSSSDVPAHDQATVNVLEGNVFIGDKLNNAYFDWLEKYCKAGPTHLILADMPLVVEHFSRSIAPGYWAAQMYALASTYRGVGWAPPGDPDADYYWTIQDQIFEWWDRYVMKIVDIMNKAPKTTVTIVVNDAPDMCGARLGMAMQERLESFGNRVELGDVLWEWAKKRSR